MKGGLPSIEKCWVYDAWVQQPRHTRACSPSCFLWKPDNCVIGYRKTDTRFPWIPCRHSL